MTITVPYSLSRERPRSESETLKKERCGVLCEVRMPKMQAGALSAIQGAAGNPVPSFPSSWFRCPHAREVYMLPGSSALPPSTFPGTYAPSATRRVAVCQAPSCLRPQHRCPLPRVCLLSRLPWPSANATSSRKLSLTVELAQTLPKVTLPFQSLSVSVSWNVLSVHCCQRLTACCTLSPPHPTTEPPGPL